MTTLHADGYEILAGLEGPSVRVAFVDETGTPLRPIPNLAAGYQLFCGVEMNSEAYREARTKLAARLASHRGAEEFHACELVNPSSGSYWHGRPVSDRQAALRFLVDLLVAHSTRIHYCFVASEQYAELLAEAQQQTSARLPRAQKVGLRHVFFGALVERLRHENGDRRRITVVADSEKPLHDALSIQAFRNPENMYGGQVIQADSRAVEGLQLADCAAYLLNRRHHSMARRAQDDLGPFDAFVLEVVNRLEPKFTDLLPF